MHPDDFKYGVAHCKGCKGPILLGQLCGCWQDFGYIDCQCIGGCRCGIAEIEESPW